jgi:hypothetical protein
VANDAVYHKTEQAAATTCNAAGDMHNSPWSLVYTMEKRNSERLEDGVQSLPWELSNDSHNPLPRVTGSGRAPSRLVPYSGYCGAV